MATGFIPISAPPAANLFDDRDFAAQRAFFSQRPALAPTPLHRCAATARTLGLRELLVKDETRRCGLNAFKALGAGFAIETLRQRGEIARDDVLACASEGNHGRAVAHVARQAGCRARVYMSATVAPARAEAIRGEGADVVLVNGSYDDAVRVMAADATANGWTVISDTSWAGYSEIPRLIMLGYTRMMDEDWPSAPTPTPGAAGLQPAGRTPTTGQM